MPGGINLWLRGLKIIGLQPPWHLATAQDVRFCYRLFLLREPDEVGWQFWTKRVENLEVSLAGLRDAFLLSEEFRQLDVTLDHPHLIEGDGFKIFYLPRDWLVGAEIARDGTYESHLVSILNPLLQPGKVFLDIGANIGFYTLLAASRVGPQGRVIAFEPHPKNIKLLEMSLRENGFKHVQLYPFAVSNTEGVVDLVTELATNNATLATPMSTSAIGDPLVIPVQAVALDSLLHTEPRIDIIKMDIEGVEPLAWLGMTGLIRRHRPIVFTEFSPDAIRHHGAVTAEEYLTMLYQAGYRLHILDPMTCEAGPAMTGTQIMAHHAEAPSHHIDLVAYPVDD